MKSAVDFDERGGTLAYIDPADENHRHAGAYTTCDKDADTSPWPPASPTPSTGTPSSRWSAATEESELVAQVMFEDEDEPASVRVPHHLRDKLPEGVREPDQREAVEVDEDDGGELVIVEILGLVPHVETISSPAIDAVSPLRAEYPAALRSHRR